MKKAMTILLIMVGLLTFILGSNSIVQTQTDPEFINLLTRLNGSRWEHGNSRMELNGDILTNWQYNNKMYSVRLQKRRFVAKDPGQAYIGEISEDGDVITEEVTWCVVPADVGTVRKYIRVK